MDLRSAASALYLRTHLPCHMFGVGHVVSSRWSLEQARGNERRLPAALSVPEWMDGGCGQGSRSCVGNRASGAFPTLTHGMGRGSG
jgi:hypothetical protein